MLGQLTNQELAEFLEEQSDLFEGHVLHRLLLGRVQLFMWASKADCDDPVVHAGEAEILHMFVYLRSAIGECVEVTATIRCDGAGQIHYGATGEAQVERSVERRILRKDRFAERLRLKLGRKREGGSIVVIVEGGARIRDEREELEGLIQLLGDSE